MWLQALRGYLRGGNLLGRALVQADLFHSMRALYLHGALGSGLIYALGEPRTRDELIHALDVERVELLDGMLAEGLAWRELSLRDGRYRLRGRRARALATETGDPYAAQINECFGYHGSAYSAIGVRMRGAQLGNYLDETGDLIARSSRMLEPPTAAFLRRCLRDLRPSSVLDIGCGSGTYLRQAVASSPATRGLGIEISEEARQLAESNIRRWGLDDRCKVAAGDIMELGETGRFDLALLFHNVYYFEPERRPVLLQTIRCALSENGALALVSYFQGRSRVATHFDVVLRSTRGNTPLPDIDDTLDLLRSNGFDPGRPSRLFPREPLFGILARPV